MNKLAGVKINSRKFRTYDCWSFSSLFSSSPNQLQIQKNRNEQPIKKNKQLKEFKIISVFNQINQIITKCRESEGDLGGGYDGSVRRERRKEEVV